MRVSSSRVVRSAPIRVWGAGNDDSANGQRLARRHAAAASEPATGAASPDPGEQQSQTSACPPMPEAWVTSKRIPFWPVQGTEDLAPDFAAPLCASPTAPYLGLVLNEAAGQSQYFRRGAFGVLPRAGKNALTSIIGADADVVADLVGAWLSGTGRDADVAAPQQMLTSDPPDPALEAGAPVGALPDGYTALPIDPFMFAASDFADSVTILDEDQLIEALGGAVIVGSDNTIVATYIGQVLRSVPTGEPSPKPPAAPKAPRGVEVQEFVVADTSIYLMGPDRDAVTSLAEQWHARLEAEG